MIRVLSLAALAVLSIMVHAQDADRSRLLSPYNLKADGSGPAPRLLVLQDQEPVLSKQNGPKLPNRVYGIYHTAEKAWVYTLTEFDGEFPEPLELLYKGSVLPGSKLGARNPYQNYELTSDYQWKPTTESEKYYFLIPARPNVIKRVTFTVPTFDLIALQKQLKEQERKNQK